MTSAWQSFQAAAPRVAGMAGTGRVALSVLNPGGNELNQAFPVTSGVPFPKGVLGSERQLRLLDGQGREAPLQVETLARWPDGSVKWALLDFQAPAGGQYSLEYGAGVARRVSRPCG